MGYQNNAVVISRAWASLPVVLSPEASLLFLEALLGAAQSLPGGPRGGHAMGHAHPKGLEWQSGATFGGVGGAVCHAVVF